jgi:hypothetical protein
MSAASAANTNDDTPDGLHLDDLIAASGDDVGGIELSVFHGTRRSYALAIA